MLQLARSSVLVVSAVLFGACTATHESVPEASTHPWAERDEYVEPATHLAFPPRLGSYRRVKVSEFSEPGLGISIEYEGWAHAEVFIYDLGYEKIATGTDSEAFQQAFSASEENLTHFTNQFPLKNGRKFLESEPVIRIEDAVAKLRVSMFMYTRSPASEAEQQMSTWLVMTAYKNKFLKLLFTHPEVEPDRSQTELRELILAFLEANTQETRHFFVKEQPI